MKEYGLVELETFVAVVESGSFNQAAERLMTSAASVSRRISALESALDTRLLNRTTRQINLTDAGHQFFQDVQNILSALYESEEKLRDGKADISGKIRIVTPLSFGVQKIAPLLPKFMKRYPRLHIDLLLEDQLTDLVAEGVDLAIRIGSLSDSTLVGTKLSDIKIGFYASEDYLARNGTPQSLKDLSEHQTLHYSLVSGSREWGLDQQVASLRGPLSANNGEVLAEAAVQGMGVVALPYFIAEKALKRGEIKPILEDVLPPVAPLYALRLSSKFTPTKVRLLIDFLKEELGEEAIA